MANFKDAFDDRRGRAQLSATASPVDIGFVAQQPSRVIKQPSTLAGDMANALQFASGLVQQEGKRRGDQARIQGELNPDIDEQQAVEEGLITPGFTRAFNDGRLSQQGRLLGTKYDAMLREALSSGEVIDSDDPNIISNTISKARNAFLADVGDKIANPAFQKSLLPILKQSEFNNAQAAIGAVAKQREQQVAVQTTNEAYNIVSNYGATGEFDIAHQSLDALIQAKIEEGMPAAEARIAVNEGMLTALEELGDDEAVEVMASRFDQFTPARVRQQAMATRRQIISDEIRETNQQWTNMERARELYRRDNTVAILNMIAEGKSVPESVIAEASVGDPEIRLKIKSWRNQLRGVGDGSGVSISPAHMAELFSRRKSGQLPDSELIQLIRTEQVPVREGGQLLNLDPGVIDNTSRILQSREYQGMLKTSVEAMTDGLITELDGADARRKESLDRFVSDRIHSIIQEEGFAAVDPSSYQGRQRLIQEFDEGKTIVGSMDNGNKIRPRFISDPGLHFDSIEDIDNAVNAMVDGNFEPIERALESANGTKSLSALQKSLGLESTDGAAGIILEFLEEQRARLRNQQNR